MCGIDTERSYPAGFHYYDSRDAALAALAELVHLRETGAAVVKLGR